MMKQMTFADAEYAGKRKGSSEQGSCSRSEGVKTHQHIIFEALCGFLSVYRAFQPGLPRYRRTLPKPISLLRAIHRFDSANSVVS